MLGEMIRKEYKWRECKKMKSNLERINFKFDYGVLHGAWTDVQRPFGQPVAL